MVVGLPTLSVGVVVGRADCVDGFVEDFGMVFVVVRVACGPSKVFGVLLEASHVVVVSFHASFTNVVVSYSQIRLKFVRVVVAAFEGLTRVVVSRSKA